jgi:plastocyanin
VSATVVDPAGSYVGNAVIGLFPGADVQAARVGGHGGARRMVALDQIHKQFVPHVLAIETGTFLNFPNSDNIRHQVYSFSEAKRFELKLYSGRTAPPILFDAPGVVVLGCNIHDWMSAYFALTDRDGHADIEVPPGRYDVKIWHPRHERGREAQVSSLQVVQPVQELQLTLAVAASDDSSGLPPS